jgi:dual specificity tyrosine-phosphorylation-regulated kinase 2/3/4
VIAAESTMSRSCSATSSLDPYYFGLQSPSDSPPPPLPAPIHLNATPDMQPNYEPPTPAKDPATIDRRGLVGVGELSTPRWDRAPQAIAEDGPDDGDDYELILPEDTESGVPDSPWTIEAIDGESAGEDEVGRPRSSLNIASQSLHGFQSKPIQHPMPRRLRSRRSATDESGGEEILYPRKALRPDQSKYSNSPDRLEESRPPLLPPVDTSPSESPLIASPPSSFGTPLKKAKKRTSDEFEMDNFGVPIPKRLGSSSGLPKDRSRDDKVAARKHRSLTSGSVSGVSGRRDSAGLPSMSSTKPVPGAAGLPDRHTRQASGSSSSSNHGEGINNRRVYTADFSHLPPSPSSSSIQHFLKHASTASNANPPVRPSSREHQVLPSPNVAHSLLRGTQEGWSYLDDEATAEALRKLDGLTGKSARARASSSFGRPASLSRPGTPGKNSSQWEGIGFVEPSKVVRRSSTNTKERASGGRELEDSDQAPRTRGLGLVADMVPNHDEHLGSAVVSSDDQLAPSIVEKTPKKSNNIHVRSSFTPKRGSASSTTYTGTPTTTTSSRDSTSLSTTTSLTSVSTSGRHSIGKAKRNSAGSDISSIHSSDATSLKDRVASLALSGEALEDEPVPPVPPLPKDLSTYRSPPASAVTYAFPAPSLGDDKRASRDSDDDRAAPVDSPLISNPTSPGSHVPSHQSPSHSAAPQPDPGPTIHKTPSKKWSFSALNIKLSSSPSSSSKSSNFLLSPRAVTFGHQLRKSASKDQALSPSSVAPNNTWTAVQPEAMASVTSLASVSSTNSTRASRSPTLAPLPTNVKTPEGRVRSRSGTDSSASTHHTSSILALAPPPASPTPSVRRANSSKRLTPSSIPFFRRSSSQSIYIPPSAPTAAPSSPTPSSGPSSSRPHATGSPTRDPSLAQSVPVSARKKSSVLSLGLPSLLKSSSRRSLHAEKNDSSKDVRDHRKADEVERDIEKSDKDKPKKDDKDRSDSRISVLMGRKRGKVCRVSSGCGMADRLISFNRRFHLLIPKS